jgi:hypothetical protein
VAEPSDAGGAAGTPATPGAEVGEVANVFLGNILYAIESCALWLEEQGKAEDAAFYRGIGRKLAEARGREKAAAERTAGG